MVSGSHDAERIIAISGCRGTRGEKILWNYSFYLKNASMRQSGLGVPCGTFLVIPARQEFSYFLEVDACHFCEGRIPESIVIFVDWFLRSSLFSQDPGPLERVSN